MRLIKPLRASFIHRVFDYRNQHNLVVTVAFCFPFAEPSALVSDPEMWKLVGQDLGRFGVLDYWMFKPEAEVLVTGACYTGEREKGSEFVRLQVGPTGKRLIDKRLYVFGDRHWTILGPSEPKMFTRMPLDYAHAFGGEKFAPNPIGKGMSPVRDESGADQHPLPNVEDPKHTIKSKGDRPPPASFAAWDLTWPIHFEKKMGTYGRDHAEKNGYSLADDIDFSLFNVAPEDQRLPEGWSGTEEIHVENMHPEHRSLETRLPGFVGRCFLRFTEKYDAKRELREVPLKIDTVHLFPHRERGIVFCRGVLPIHTTDASDIELAFVGVDDVAPERRRPRSHYELVLQKRLDPERGALEALRDRDLMPEGATIPTSGAQVGDRLEEVSAPEGHALQNAHRRAVLELARVKEKLVAAGLDPSSVPDPPPPPSPVPSFDQLPEVVDQAMSEQVSAEQLAKEKKAELAEQLRALSAEHGFALPDLDKGPQHGEGPPKYSAEAELEKLRQLLRLAEEGGNDLPELRAKIEDPNFRAQLLDVQRRLYAAYRISAHFQAPARPADEASSLRAKSSLLALLNDLEPELRDFTGADLSGMDLPGVNLEGAFLEATNLEGTNLSGAKLKDAVLAHANLGKARFDDAQLAGANLGRVSAVDTSFRGADLRGAAVYGADFTRADLSRTHLGGVQALEVTAVGANFQDSTSDIPVFLKSDLTGANFRGARVRQGVFVECKVDDIDARNADFSLAAFLHTSGNGASFAGATLENLRVVHSSFERADFHGCPMLNSNLRGAKLASSNFSFASLRRSDLSEADLGDANLEGLVATESLFMGTILTRANMRGANLMLCVMHRAELAGADVSKANLFCADLTGARGDDKTSFSGSNVKRALVAGVFSG